jgi:hypothetical protein
MPTSGGKARRCGRVCNESASNREGDYRKYGEVGFVDCLQDLVSEAIALRTLIKINRRTAKVFRAIEESAVLVRHFKVLGRSADEADAMRVLSALYADTGNLKVSLAVASQAAETARVSHDASCVVRCLTHFAKCSALIGGGDVASLLRDAKAIAGRVVKINGADSVVLPRQFVKTSLAELALRMSSDRSILTDLKRVCQGEKSFFASQ